MLLKNLASYRRIALTLTIGWVAHAQSEAQEQPYKNISIASPNAASLGKYADVPVNYHTGIPEITVPIYTINAGRLQLPIGLSYHSSGLKVMEPASWVGAGWSLNAGGVITRSVMGQPDEKGTNTGLVATHGHISDYGFNSYLYNSSQQDWVGFAEGRKDGEPDLFFFNFAGHSGKFYFSDDRTPILLPEEDLRIEFDYIPIVGESIRSFKITTPDGTKYYFGRTSDPNDIDPVEITSAYTDQGGLSSGSVVSSWLLNKIESADNQFTILLQYQSENYGFPTIATFSVNGILQPSLSNPQPYEYSLVKNIITGVRLQQITFPDGNVNFIPGAVRTDLSDNAQSMTDNVNQQAKSLGAIEIVNGSNFCKRFTLSYGYFSDDISPLSGYFSSNNIQTDKLRLRLETVQESTCDLSVSIPAHKFDYFSEVVARRLTFGQDHWGFSNGITSNNTLIPTFSVNNFTEIQGANRDAAWPAMRGGALKRVTYPTGGFTDFEFEPNKTYVSFSKYTKNQAASISVGFSAPAFSSESNVNLTAGSYELKINSVGGTSNATVIISLNSAFIGSVSTDPGTTNQITVTLSQTGTYTLLITKDCPSTGIGATGTVSIWTPNQVSGNTLVGGLRVSKITTDDAITSVENVTSFIYETGPESKSTGILYSRPTYVQIIRNDLIKDVGYWHPSSGFTPSCSANGCISCDGATTLPFYKSGATLRPMGSSQSNHIGYNEVKVVQAGNGFKIFRYYGSNVWDLNVDDVANRSLLMICSPSIPNYPAAPLSFEPQRGELKSEEIFDESGRQLKSTIYTPTYQNSLISTPGFIVSVKGNQVLGTFYSLVSARKLQEQINESIIDENGISTTTSTTVYYESPSHHLMTKKQTNLTPTDIRTTKYKYSFDFLPASSSGIADGTMILSNQLSSCLNNYNTARIACGGSSTCLTNAYLSYVQCQNTSRIDYINYRRANFTNASNTYATNLSQAKQSSDGNLKPLLEMQQVFQNAPVEMSNWKNGNVLKAAYNTYEYATDIPTAVYLKNVASVNLAIPENQFTDAVISGNTVSKDARYQIESSLTFSSGNLTELKSRDRTTTYIWGYKNTSLIGKIENAPKSQVAYTSFEPDGSGNWVLGSVDRTAGARTGEFSYNLTAGAISKSGLSSGQQFVLSLWQKTGILGISGATVNQTKNGQTIDGWTYVEHTITLNASTLSLSGNRIIDELRLYPSKAQMTTYTYHPLAGITSECDINGKVMNYKYDGLGRLKMIRDNEGNILKTYTHKYQEQQ